MKIREAINQVLLFLLIFETLVNLFDLSVTNEFLVYFPPIFAAM